MPRYEVTARVRCGAPPEAVWALLTDLPRWTAVRETHLATEVVSAVPPTDLRYRITGGLPVREHEAHVELLPADGGTDVVWSHTFRARLPGTGGFLRGRLESQAADSARRLAEAAASLR